jgi:hypothetical protein
MPGIAGATGASGMGLGGGIFRSPGAHVTINDTNITANSASTAGSDQFGSPES